MGLITVMSDLWKSANYCVEILKRDHRYGEIMSTEIRSLQILLGINRGK